MFALLEIAFLLVLGAAVLAMIRAASARPDERGLALAARLALAAWAAFAVMLLIDFDAIAKDPAGTLRSVGIVVICVLGVLGYRHLLSRLRDRANR